MSSATVLCAAVWPSHQSWMIFWLNNTCYLTSPDTNSLIVDQNEYLDLYLELKNIEHLLTE